MADPNIFLSNNPYSAPKFYYPENLGADSQQPYTIIDIRESVAKGGRSIGTVALQLPDEIRSQYHANYEDTDMGVLGFDPKIPKTIGSWDDLGKMAGSAWKRAYDTITNDFSGSAKGAVGQSLQTAAITTSRGQRDFGMILNPHMAPLFQGMAFRVFTLSWRVMARNAAESEAIRSIIYQLKYHMVPDAPEGAAVSRYLYYPENFVIGFFTPKGNQMFLVAPCVLEDFDVLYNGSGVPSFFEDTGAPVSIVMTAQFREIEIMTKTRIRQGY